MAVELVVWGAEEAPPLDIGKGGPLEEEGEWVGGDILGGWVASSSGISRKVGWWRLFGHL